jgi:hypothetical protein
MRPWTQGTPVGPNNAHEYGRTLVQFYNGTPVMTHGTVGQGGSVCGAQQNPEGFAKAGHDPQA